MEKQTRLQDIEDACEVWKKRLLDLSRRNQLLYFLPLKRGTIDFSEIGLTLLEPLLKGKSVKLNKFFPSSQWPERVKSLRQITRKARENLEEKGLETLFLGLGIVTWTALDKGRDPESPLVLLPVKVIFGSGNLGSVSLQIQGDFQLNSILSHFWLDQFGIDLDLESLSELAIGNKGELDFEPIFDHLEKYQSEIEGLKINRKSLHLANFAFQKMAMVNDLVENLSLLNNHEIIAAIAGNQDARIQMSQSGFEENRSSLDQKLPGDEHLILDIDSSQHVAVNSVLKGQSCVIQGPPGTGKSQTIANLISSLIAERKKVLFVAEKRAALEAVKKRLTSVGLDKLVLDVHGAEISKSEFIRHIGNSLKQIKHAPSIDAYSIHSEYIQKRDVLNSHVAKMHTKLAPSGKSIFDLRALLLGYPAQVKKCQIRWRGKTLQNLTEKNVRAIQDKVAILEKFSDIFLKKNTSLWVKSKVQNNLDIQSCRDHCSSLLLDWDDFTETLSELKKIYPIEIKSQQCLDKLCKTFLISQQLLTRYDPEFFTQDMQSFTKILAPTTDNRGKAFFYWLLFPSYRKVSKTVKTFLKKEKKPLHSVAKDVELAKHVLVVWSHVFQQKCLPFPPLNIVSLKNHKDKFETRLRDISQILGCQGLEKISFSKLKSTLQELHGDQVTPYQVVEVFQSTQSLLSLGLKIFLQEIQKLAVPPSSWKNCFEYSWLQSCYDEAILKDSSIQSFMGKTHTKEVESFQELDNRKLQITADRITRKHSQWAIESMDGNPEQVDILKREVKKKRRHLPLRKLINQTSTVITSVCPCWMGSPLSISQLFNAKQYFDVVIFDEASQVLTEDAISSIMRGSQIVVAGDRQQLPPTSFFISGYPDQEEDGNKIEGFESLLDNLSSFLPDHTLKWHYRSRDERLIAFSNHHIYEDCLITFPGIGGTPPLKHILAPYCSKVNQGKESSAAEVNKVVELILEHAQNFPKQSLGVIALGLKHAQRIQHALDEYLRENKIESDFFIEEKEERFFIKNLERVQGDERDSILLSIGYGKNAQGELPHRFGPINQSGGERRLNVAITRARKKMTVVSSFLGEEIDLRKSKARGVELLKLYLEYAASGGSNLEKVYSEDHSMNPFEFDIYQTLSNKGLDLLPQFGVGKYRLDFAVVHPEKKGRNILAIECDGASYHSSYTARERDRLRQQQLEALGWNFCRIWSTDWFLRKEEEVKRVMKEYRNVLAHCTSQENTITEVKPSPVVEIPSQNERNKKPSFETRLKIDEYPRSKLEEIIEWIESDELNRTKEELLEEMIKVLGYKRRGPRIVSVLTKVINGVRR